MIYFNHPPTLTEKVELDAAYRISHAEMRSTPRPMTWPCTAAITGNGARSGAATACWKASIFFRACKEVLALSLEPFVLSPSTLTSCNILMSHIVNVKCSDGHVQSNPAVKIVGNADDRTTARTSYPSFVNESKSLPYACKNSVENALTGPL